VKKRFFAPALLSNLTRSGAVSGRISFTLVFHDVNESPNSAHLCPQHSLWTLCLS